MLRKFGIQFYLVVHISVPMNKSPIAAQPGIQPCTPAKAEYTPS